MSRNILKKNKNKDKFWMDELMTFALLTKFVKLINYFKVYHKHRSRALKVVIHVEMTKAAPKSPFVIFKN